MTTYIPSITLPDAIFANPAASILVPVALGLGVGYSVSPKSTQKTYLALKQPPYRPPPQVFGPTWTALYTLMGYSAYRAWTTGTRSLNPNTVQLTKVETAANLCKLDYRRLTCLATTQQGATLFTIQLGLNLIWMPLFFRLKRPIEATADITVLTGVTGYLTYIWSQVDSVAAWSMAPYLGWLTFATYLSAGTGYLNNWNFADKERETKTSDLGSGMEKDYVNKAPEQK
ncbi:MAG: hypothetical protein Q9219_002553 [cf. Caloplaca sp. 3 TL-2023]